MSYWTDRQAQLNKALEKDEEKLKKKLSRLYDQEARRLEKEIAAYYKLYGKDNVIEYRKLLEALPDNEKLLLIKDFDEFAKLNPDYAHLLPVRESIYKLDRLQGLQYSVKLQQMNIGAKENELIKDHLNKTAKRSLETASEVMGFGSSFYVIDKELMKFVDVPWANNMKFSDRIWGNKEKLSQYLSTDLAQGFARGDSYDRLVKQIMDRFGKVSRNDAYRLVFTEGTFVMNEASIQPFTEDFEYYSISTVNDSKVCPVCRDMQTQTEAEPVPMVNRVPGENFPPFHPYCRCRFTVAVTDWDKWKEDYLAKHGYYGDKIERRLNV